MTTITIPIEEERLARLERLAASCGMSAADVLGGKIDELLEENRPATDAEHRAASAYVLKKNAELYRRLA